jgi:hypothetical protein
MICFATLWFSLDLTNGLKPGKRASLRPGISKPFSVGWAQALKAHGSDWKKG